MPLFSEEHRAPDDEEYEHAPTLTDLTDFDSDFWLCSVLSDHRPLETLRLYEETHIVTVYRLYAARELSRYYADKRWLDGSEGTIKAEFPLWEQQEREERERQAAMRNGTEHTLT